VRLPESLRGAAGTALADYKRRVLSDTWTFCAETKVLPDLREQPHREMCAEIDACEPSFGREEELKKKIYLAPRYTYKTSIIAAHDARLVLKSACKDIFPGYDIRIVLVRAIIQDSMAMLASIQQMLKHPKVVAIFGDIEELCENWNENFITLKNRSRPMLEPTIDTAAIGRSKTGYHPDYVQFDDLVNDKNYRSPRIHARSRLTIDSYGPIVGSRGSFLVSGTHWQQNDVYKSYMEQDDEREAALFEQLRVDGASEEAAKAESAAAREWKLYVRGAYNDDGTLFFPERLSEAFLRSERERISRSDDPRLYSCWYLNSPIEAGMEWFPPPYEYFDALYYREPTPHLEILDPDDPAEPDVRRVIERVWVRTTATLDPALTSYQSKGNESSDFYGFTIVCCGYDATGEERWYTMVGEEFRLVSDEASDRVLKRLVEFEPETLVIESGGLDADFATRIGAGITEYGLRTTIISYMATRDETLLRGSRGKAQRIEALRGHRAKFRFRRGHCDALTRQLRKYPDTEHDDVLDSFAKQRVVAMPPVAATRAQLSDEDREAQEELESGAGVYARRPDGRIVFVPIGEREAEAPTLGNRGSLGAQRLAL
jgi:hypothetical protein